MIKMKKIIWSSFFILISFCVYSADYNVISDTIISYDTTVSHSYQLIDEHVVIQDTILIEKYTEIIQHLENVRNSKDFLEITICIVSILLVLLSVINHYIKKKNNGKKIH